MRTEILLPSAHHALHPGTANMLAVAVLVKKFVLCAFLILADPLLLVICRKW